MGWVMQDEFVVSSISQQGVFRVAVLSDTAYGFKICDAKMLLRNAVNDAGNE